MDLLPLYKYLDISGAKLTLENKTFKHSKPSDFNDTDDLTIRSIFPEGVEEALEKIANNFSNIILQHLDTEPTCDSPMREKIQLLQHVYQSNPDAVDLVRKELAKSNRPLYDVEHYRKLFDDHISTINEFMQGYRVLCVTTHNDSDHMWTKYADGHRGIVLRVKPNVIKDSKFQRFRPVIYCNQRPPLYKDSLEFIAGSLFGDKEAQIRETIDRIIYTKTLAWQIECEYRLAIPIRSNEETWNTLPYYSEEIAELYLGCEMEDCDIKGITAKGLNLNPNILIFQSRKNEAGKLYFEPY